MIMLKTLVNLQVLTELTRTMLELVSTVESLNSTVMSAMTPRTPSPLTEEPPSADKVDHIKTLYL